MNIIPTNTHFDFIGKSKILFTVSAVLVGLSVILCFVRGFNYGIDFAGGTEIHIKADGVTTQDARSVLARFGAVDIQEFEGKQNEFLVRFKNISMVDDATINRYIEQVKQTFGDVKVLKTHFDSQVGDRIEIWFDKQIDDSKLKKLAEDMKIPATGVLQYNKVGDRHIYKIMLEGLTSEIVSEINKANPAKEVELMKVELVGPKVGQKLRYSALQAILYSLIAILVYIAFRFNFQFAVGAVVALFHDVMISLAVWSIFQISFDLTSVAALLTIVGYSINDTIVIYDRIRENLNNSKAGKTLTEKMNTSLNETLSRTLLTSITTLIAVLALLIFGGETIKGFSTMMTIGLISGTYSSLFIASPIPLIVEKYRNRKAA